MRGRSDGVVRFRHQYRRRQELACQCRREGQPVFCKRRHQTVCSEGQSTSPSQSDDLDIIAEKVGHLLSATSRIEIKAKDLVMFFTCSVLLFPPLPNDFERHDLLWLIRPFRHVRLHVFFR